MLIAHSVHTLPTLMNINVAYSCTDMSLGSIAFCRHGNEVLHQTCCLLCISQPAPPPGESSQIGPCRIFHCMHSSYYKLFNKVKYRYWPCLTLHQQYGTFFFFLHCTPPSPLNTLVSGVSSHGVESGTAMTALGRLMIHRMSVHMNCWTHQATTGLEATFPLSDTLYMVNKARLVPRGCVHWTPSFSTLNQRQVRYPFTLGAVGGMQGWTYRCEGMLRLHLLSHAMCCHRDWVHGWNHLSRQRTELFTAADAHTKTTSHYMLLECTVS